MTTRQENTVTFYSPGTLFSEQTTKPIAEWDTRVAVGMAEKIEERHGARPFGFRFSTFTVSDPVPDGRGGELDVEPRLEKDSGMHFLGGTVRTYAEVLAGNDPKEEILRDNVRNNRWPAVVENRNSYLSTHPFDGDNVIVDAAGEVVARASDYPEPPDDDVGGTA